MSNPVPTQDMKISYVDPAMNPAGNPQMAYAGGPQYASAGVPPPGGQYPQWTAQPGMNPNFPPQQGVPPGYQYNPGAPQFMPQQPGAPLTATPIPALNRSSAPVDCPVCGQRALTSTRKVVGSSNHLWAAIACFFFCLGCIPYLLDDLKDVEHSCSNCGTHLATFYKSGGTEPMVRR
ncbi:hypothetical protein CPB86DRAFT_782522 [Serendipita vermifera]|nr:hypothetical protein CPB86DRAFT_782522 [Serendipita vermifera]